MLGRDLKTHGLDRHSIPLEVARCSEGGGSSEIGEDVAVDVALAKVSTEFLFSVGCGDAFGELLQHAIDSRLAEDLLFKVPSHASGDQLLL